MVNLFTILGKIWSSLISYLRPAQPKIKSGDDQTKEPVNECEQVRKQLQQTNTSLSILLFQVFTEYKQIDKQLNDTTTENESLKQAVRELQKQSETIERERNEAREISTKLSLENTLLEQKIVQLESHKEVLIQELSGSLSGQDIEFISWEFLIQKVKEVTNQLNEEVAHNQSLIKTNRDLQQEKDFLTRELDQLEDNNTRLTQDNSQLQANKNSLELELRRTLDRIKPLERAKDKLEQELERKLDELNEVEFKLRHAEEQIEQLEEELKGLQQTKKSLEVELKQEKAKVTSLEQKTKDLEKVKNQLDAELKQEKAKIASFEPRNKSPEQVIKFLEISTNQEMSQVATLEIKPNDFRTKTGENQPRNATNDPDELTINISQLNQTIKQLEDKIKHLEESHQKPAHPEQLDEVSLSEQYDYDDDEVSLLEEYNELVYYVQKNLRCSGIEELDNWEKTEEFYIELISRLCFIDTMLIAELECFASNTYGLYNSPTYSGKLLYWTNDVVRWELSSFLNSKF